MVQIFQTEPRQVSVQDVREQLRSLWMSEALTDRAVIRAHTHNLIVYVPATLGDINQAMERVIKATLLRPGRVILIHADSTGVDGLNAWVTTYCRPVKNHKVCGELVALAASGHLRDEVHSTVSSLLLPDLPVVLVWLDQPSMRDHLFLELLEETDRVIFDSSRSEHIVETLRAQSLLPARFQIGDLTWARLTPFRRLVAHLVDEIGAHTLVSRLSSVHIEVVSKAVPSSAVLLAGWLADSLKWEFNKAESTSSSMTLRYSTSQDAVSVKLNAVESGTVPHGTIMRCVFQGAAGAAFISLTYVPERACIELTNMLDGLSERRHGYAAGPVDAASALAEELDFGYDPVYRRALQAAVNAFV